MSLAHRLLLSEVEDMISRAELRAEEHRRKVLSPGASDRQQAQRDLKITLAGLSRLREFYDGLRAERVPGQAPTPWRALQ